MGSFDSIKFIKLRMEERGGERSWRREGASRLENKD